MNFLKVKKFLAIFLISFFISIGFVSAKDLTGSIHTSNESRNIYNNSINLFNESKNRSNFMDFIYSHGNNIGSHLNDYYSIGNNEFFNNQFSYGISILSKSDLSFFSEFRHIYKDYGSDKQYTIDNYDLFIKHLFSDNSSGFTKYHSVHYLNDHSFDDVEYLIFFSTSNYQNSVNYGAFNINEQYSSLSIFPKYIFMFDNNGDNVGYIAFDYDSEYWTNAYNSNFYTSLIFRFPFDDLSNPDMTSWYFYSFKMNITSGLFDKVYSEYFYLDGSNDYVKVSTNAGYTGIVGWFKSLSGSNYDLDYYNMRFVYEDVFYQKDSESFSLFDYWIDSSSFIIPNNYLSFDVSKSKKGYYLTPKSGCKYNDYLLYYSGASNLSVFALYFNYYKLNLDNSSLDLNKRFGVFSSKSYINYSYDPLKDLSISVDEFKDYTINLYQYSTKYSYVLYYNPSCYSYDLASSSDINLDFSDGNFTLSSTDIQTNYNNDTVNGSNYVSGGTKPSGGSSNGDVNDSDIINGSISQDGSYISNIINNLSGYASSIFGSIQSLVGMATIFLVGLPTEIYNFMFSVFAIGMIIFIIKLFH